MNPRVLPLLALLLPLALAGCVGGDEAPVEASSAESEPGSSAAADASAASASAPQDAAAPSETSADDNGMAPVRVEETVEWHGELGMQACVPFAPDSCVVPIGVGGGGWYHFLDVEGAPQAAALTLTWASRAPHEDKLHFALVAAEGSRDSWSGSALVSVDGTSPLTLDAAALEVPEGHSLVLVVRPARLTPSPVYGWVESGLTFTAEGTVVSMVTPLH